jgi:DNA-binding transcriptional LysR family regulator
LAAEAGLGLAMLPTFIVHAQLRRGSLVQVLPGWAPPSLALHAVWPPTRHLPAKTRSFVEFLAGRFGEPPPWESGL